MLVPASSKLRVKSHLDTANADRLTSSIAPARIKAVILPLVEAFSVSTIHLSHFCQNISNTQVLHFIFRDLVNVYKLLIVTNCYKYKVLMERKHRQARQ